MFVGRLISRFGGVEKAASLCARFCAATFLFAFSLSIHAASGDNAVPGVKVTVGSQSQAAAFVAGTNEVTLTFDVSGQPDVAALTGGQSTALPVTAVVDPGLLADACGCTINTLNQQAIVRQPTSVPTLSEMALVALVGAMFVLTLRSRAGQRGLKALAMLGLGIALIQPTQELRAAAGNALDSMTVAVTGKTVTVTVKRNAACTVNLAPVLPPSPLKFPMKGGVLSTILPAATDPEGDNLTYSVTGIPADWTFDATTRTLTWPTAYRCFDLGMYPEYDMSKRTFTYSVKDTCHSTATSASLSCYFVAFDVD